ncbi:MAG: MoaD/ThiS family protein [Spirochaetes bacterium]|nr:MoaD/ThiS family protein [Spirochaetota bacterium]NMB63236.1 MoaD/ThiS family protein [Spirochaetota bacterium]
MEKKKIGITVEGAGVLRKELFKHTVTLDCDARVEDLAKKIKIKKGLQIAFFRNGKRLNRNVKLHDGDTIKVVPLVFGG